MFLLIKTMISTFGVLTSFTLLFAEIKKYAAELTKRHFLVTSSVVRMIVKTMVPLATMTRQRVFVFKC